MHGRLLEDLAGVFLLVCSTSTCLTYFHSFPQDSFLIHMITLHERSQANTHAHRKAAGYETHLCMLRTSSSLTSNELLGFVRQDSNSALYTGRTKLGCNLILISYQHIHNLKELHFVLALQFAQYMGTYCLPVANMAHSATVLFPPKSIANLKVISVVAGLGLTSLVFIRNTSLSLCWYKST